MTSLIANCSLPLQCSNRSCQRSPSNPVISGPVQQVAPEPQRLAPIGLTAGVPIVIVTRKNFLANNLKEFVDYVKKTKTR